MELLIVIVVIAILAAISIVAYNGIQERANTSATIAQVKNIINTIKIIEVDEGRYTGETCIVPSDAVSGTTCPWSPAWYSNTPIDASFIAKIESTNGQKIKLNKYGSGNPAGQMFYHGNFYSGSRTVFYYGVGPNSDCGLPNVLVPTPDYANLTVTGAKYSARESARTHCYIEVTKF